MDGNTVTEIPVYGRDTLWCGSSGNRKAEDEPYLTPWKERRAALDSYRAWVVSALTDVACMAVDINVIDWFMHHKSHHGGVVTADLRRNCSWIFPHAPTDCLWELHIVRTAPQCQCHLPIFKPAAITTIVRWPHHRGQLQGAIDLAFRWAP